MIPKYILDASCVSEWMIHISPSLPVCVVCTESQISPPNSVCTECTLHDSLHPAMLHGVTVMLYTVSGSSEVTSNDAVPFNVEL